jgi:putative DNA primase/helicase
MKFLAAHENIDANDLDFDAHPHLLNCPNGTLDLTTGRLRDHDPADRITKRCATAYHPFPDCPAWERHLDHVFQGDAELIRYFAWVVGYTLTGYTHNDCFFMPYGASATGKSTTLSAIKDMLGKDYAMALDPEELLQHKHARHSTGLASLRGARMAVLAETNEGARWNEGRLKALTGGDTIQARFIAKDTMEFTPEVKLFLATNARPQFNDTGGAVLRRVRVLPFNNPFQEGKRDPQIDAKLKEEHEGILAWAVNALLKEGPNEPEVPAQVQSATYAYATDMDILGQFEQDTIAPHPHGRVYCDELFRAWNEYNPGNGLSMIAFNRKMLEKGYAKERCRHGMYWNAIVLKGKDTDTYAEA